MKQFQYFGVTTSEKPTHSIVEVDDPKKHGYSAFESIGSWFISRKVCVLKMKISCYVLGFASRMMNRFFFQNTIPMRLPNGTISVRERP